MTFIYIYQLKVIKNVTQNTQNQKVKVRNNVRSMSWADKRGKKVCISCNSSQLNLSLGVCISTGILPSRMKNMKKGHNCKWNEEEKRTKTKLTRNNAASSGNTNGCQSCKQLEEWPCWLPPKLQHTNRVKDWWIPNKTFRVSNGACSLITRHEPQSK